MTGQPYEIHIQGIGHTYSGMGYTLQEAFSDAIRELSGDPKRDENYLLQIHAIEDGRRIWVIYVDDEKGNRAPLGIDCF